MRLSTKASPVLCFDIGGTSTRYAMASFSSRNYKILFKGSKESNKLRSLTKLIKEIIKGNNIRPKAISIASAGIIKKNRAIMKKNSFSIDTRKIENALKIRCHLINDFEAVAYSIPAMNKKSLFIVNKGKKKKNANYAVIGAGTGLGKAMAVFSKEKKGYSVIASEFGHSDFPAERSDLELLEFIRKRARERWILSYEELLSGRGLEAIYSYLLEKEGGFAKSRNKKNNKSKTNAKLTAAEISKLRKKDRLCREAFKLFVKFYARFARNVAIDSLCYSGIYIAGGIALKNTDMFGSFNKEFFKNSYFRKILKDIPVAIITTEDAGLIGAANYARAFRK